MDEIAARLKVHPEERLSLAAMARLAGLSPPQFVRCFRARFGASPVQYAITARLEAAKHLLALDRLSVKETAYSLAYSSPYAFSRQFRAGCGYPPSEHARRSAV